MGQIKDLTGKRFGSLTVIRKHPELKGGRRAQWICDCDCGKRVIKLGKYLSNGDTVGCGDRRCTPLVTHGDNGTPFYQSWQAMKQRCQNPNTKAYKNYGGRGIKVCRRWQKYENFKEDMFDSWFPKAILDRKDGDGNYCKENCEWTTRKESAWKTRRVVWYEYQGEKIHRTELAKRLGINYQQIQYREKQGWSPEEIINFYENRVK